LSFMSQFSSGQKAPTPSPSPPNGSPLNNSDNSIDNGNGFPIGAVSESKQPATKHQRVPSRPLTPPTDGDYNGHGSPLNGSPPTTQSPHRHKRSTSRPLSMVQTYQPRIMDVNEDTIPELLPVFSYLNSHSNKLYHEGYFLKLDDQNSRTS
jgi:CCR4-NOT transcriptional complex subunit CAF120